MAARPGARWLIYVVLLLSLVVGVVAALLVGGTPGPPPAHAGEVIINLPPYAWGLLFLSPLLIGWAVVLVYRAMSEKSRFGQSLVGFAAIAAVAILFVYILAVVGGGGGGTIAVSGSSTGANNTTNNSTNSTPGHTSGPNGTGTTTPLFGASLHLPGWALVAFIVGLCAVAGVVAVPGVLSALIDRRPKGPGGGGDAAREVRNAAQQALAEASQALSAGADPRATIVRLYQRLIATLVPKVAQLDQLTAEEIRTVVLAGLRVRPDAAEALTRLFEEARYSTHPMGADAADRCRQALTLVVADLARVPAPVAS